MSTLRSLASIEPIDIPSRYRHIVPVPQQPNFAAHIEGLDLGRPLSVEVKRELYQALLDFEVIFLPPQQITLDQHVELASIFGTVAPGAFFPRKDGHPLVEVIAFDEQRPPEVNVWHSDLTCAAARRRHGLGQPVARVCGAVARAAAIPVGVDGHPYLGDQRLARRAGSFGGIDTQTQALAKYPPVQQPVVRTHPESGKKVLFVNENFTRHIDGVHFRESRGLLEFLREWIVQPEFTYTHKWRQNGIAIWDNRTTQH